LAWFQVLVWSIIHFGQIFLLTYRICSLLSCSFFIAKVFLGAITISWWQWFYLVCFIFQLQRTCDIFHPPGETRYDESMYDPPEIVEMAQWQSLYQSSLLNRSEGDGKTQKLYFSVLQCLLWACLRFWCRPTCWSSISSYVFPKCDLYVHWPIWMQTLYLACQDFVIFAPSLV
jgi:hypothetical protein